MKNDPYVLATFLKAKERDQWAADGTRPIVTISRQHGTGGDLVAIRTAELLTKHGPGTHPWIAVDKEIAERVITEHHLPQRITGFLTGEETASIEGHIEGMLGIRDSYATIIEKMTLTMIHLAKLGHVVLVGRASHLVTAGFPRAVHVRVIGSFEHRVERLMASENCSRDDAATKIMEVDETRRHFVARHFNSDVNDPLKYDLIFNMDRITVEEAARQIAHLVTSPDFRDKEAQRLADLRHHVLG